MSKFGSVMLFVGLLAAAVQGFAQERKQGAFDAPFQQAFSARAQQLAVEMLGRGENEAAEKILRQLIGRAPNAFRARYNLACVLAKQEKTDEALEELNTAVELGFRDPQHLQADADLVKLRDEPRFAKILELAAKPLPPAAPADPVEPATASDGQVVIGEENVVWSNELGMFKTAVVFPKEAPDPIAIGLGESGDRLRAWHADGVAAGNHGDLYDNHDSDHSNMNYKALPQLTRVEYSEQAKARQLHHGLQRHFLFNAPTIGNSSTAITGGPIWRCQGRLALTSPNGPQRMYIQYRANQLYFYPEHRDHDPGRNGQDGGYGDVFPANTPYLILSQGSSGSDRAFMAAVAQTLAAFRPAVKQRLIDQGLLMPTVQMIFRMSNKMIGQTSDYLSGKAHPTVFDGEQLDVLKMVDMAHDLQPDALPPLALLQVVEEDESRLGIDYFDASPREKLCDTPCAIARVVKSTKLQRRMVVSAASSIDPQGKPLEFHWVLLRGDPERVEIRPRTKEGDSAELIVSHHPRSPISAGSTMESSRVDIGVFAFNGEHYSAPSFISFFFPEGEERVYDKQGRIVSVDYNSPAARKNYVDPLIDPRRDWRDEYHYGDNGELQGWTRIRGKEREQFTADGRLVVMEDEAGNPQQTVEVRYTLGRDPRGSTVLEQHRIEE